VYYLACQFFKIPLWFYQAVLCPFLSRVLSMQRLIKGFAVGILCLQWSLPASAQMVADCKVSGNPNPLPLLANISSTKLDAEGFFRLTCFCDNSILPFAINPMGAQVKLSIMEAMPASLISAQADPSAGIRLSGSSDFDLATIPVDYLGGEDEQTYRYSVRVSRNGEPLQPGLYSVTVKFELSPLPQCTITF
jgi:hypothetical protein